MSIIAGYITPHPPLIFPEIGRGQERKISSTIEAFREVAAEIAKLSPDTVVIVSPHAKSFADFFQISSGRTAAGDMSEFSAPEVKIQADYDAEFTELLDKICQNENFPAGLGSDNPLDHATMIPIRFIKQAAPTVKFARLSISGLALESHYQLGQLIAKTADQLGHKIVVLTSGDLSHRLLDSGPYGYSPEGPKFDQQILEILKTADFPRLLAMSPEFCDRAGECGQRPITVLAGALSKKLVIPKLLSYEGPFGVGYAVATFGIAESPAVKLARQTVEEFISTGREIALPPDLPPELIKESAGVFVSIKKLGELRGCIGTIQPAAKNIALEICDNAISAATRDPRFQPITADELPLLSYSVDILGPTEPVHSLKMLDPQKYGVVVSQGGKRGLLLPNIDGIDTVAEQLAIALEKANIPQTDLNKVKLERFTVKRYY